MKDLITISLIFVLPLVLIYSKIIPRHYYITTLIVAFIASLAVSFFEKIPAVALGIRLDNLQQTWLPWTIFTIVGVIAILCFAKYEDASVIPNWWKQPHFQYIFILISFAQVFLFLGFLIPKLNGFIPNIWLAILINALLFTLIHLIYSDFRHDWLILILGGFGFAALYVFYPNFLLAGISHSILNFTIVIFGFLSILG